LVSEKKPIKQRRVKVKRYTMVFDNVNEEIYGEYDDSGEWVKFKDVRRCFGVGFECNCADNWETKPTWDYSEHEWTQHEWICPAHGYKKL